MPDRGDVLGATKLRLAVLVDIGEGRLARHDFVLFDAVHGEGTDTEGHVAGGETVLFENFEDLLGTLDGDGVPVKSLYVRIEDLISLGVNRTTKNVPETEYGLRNDLYTVTAVTTDEEAPVVVENFVLEGRENVVHHVPVIVAVAHATERSVGVEFGEGSLDEDTLTVRVDVLVLVLVAVVPGVEGAVGAHHEMLSGHGAEADLFLATVAVVHSLKVGNDRDGGGVDEGQAPCRASLERSIQALVATEVEVTEGTSARNAVFARFVVVLVNDFTVGVADRGADHRVPEFSGNQGLQGLTEPGEVRVGVGDAENRAVDGNLGAFRERDNLNRQVSELVEIADFLEVADTGAHGLLHVVLVLVDHLFLRSVEEVLVEVVDEERLAECLQPEVHDLVPPVHTAHARREIGHGFGHTLGQHFGMDRLVEILEKECVGVEHAFICFKLSWYSLIKNHTKLTKRSLKVRRLW